MAEEKETTAMGLFGGNTRKVSGGLSLRESIPPQTEDKWRCHIGEESEFDGIWRFASVLGEMNQFSRFSWVNFWSYYFSSWRKSLRLGLY